jgi:hypothetical protein
MLTDHCSGPVAVVDDSLLTACFDDLVAEESIIQSLSPGTFALRKLFG